MGPEKVQGGIGNPSITIVYGAFKAMGDLLCACPVIKAELDAGSQVHLLLFNNKALLDFVQLIDFGSNAGRLKMHFLPVPGGLSAFRAFFREMRAIDPDLVWISPHAPAPASSWKIPLLMRFVQKRYWKHAELAGADSERMSFLFDRRIAIDRDLPFVYREWNAFRAVRENLDAQPCGISFHSRIASLRNERPVYDLLIHPGANAANRRWPFSNYADVVRSLALECKIAVIGLPADVEEMRAALPSDRGIDFLTGSLEDSLVAIARSRVLLTMDSGNVHFARVLQVPAVALFGKSDPATVIPADGLVTAIYEKKFPCQPCGKAYCSQPEVYCMNALSPELVTAELQRHWKGFQRIESSHVRFSPQLPDNKKVLQREESL